jgi:glucosamine 6-phosphate synthetase-like amidotransferase/phosphosugar isomerase protein
MQLHGADAIVVYCKDEPHRLIGARAGLPLILGVGKDSAEHFLASDGMALASVTDQIVCLKECDVVDVQLGRYWLLDKAHKPLDAAQRPVKTVYAHSGVAELGPYVTRAGVEVGLASTKAITTQLAGLFLLAEEGRTMVVVTHEMGFAREVSNQLVFLHKGQIEEQGDSAEVLTRPRSDRLRAFLSNSLK